MMALEGLERILQVRSRDRDRERGFTTLFFLFFSRIVHLVFLAVYFLLFRSCCILFFFSTNIFSAIIYIPLFVFPIPLVFGFMFPLCLLPGTSLVWSPVRSVGRTLCVSYRSSASYPPCACILSQSPESYCCALRPCSLQRLLECVLLLARDRPWLIFSFSWHWLPGSRSRFFSVFKNMPLSSVSHKMMKCWCNNAISRTAAAAVYRLP